MTSMPDYGPRGAQVAAFIADLAARDDQALWELEEAIGENLTIGSHGSPWSTPGPDGRSWPSTRPAAEASGRLLAWYEAGHYALLAVTPRDDGSVPMEVPGQASTVSLPHLARLAPSIAQALVVRDQLTTNAFLEAIAGWPEVVEGYLVERLDALTGLPGHEAFYSELARLVRVGEPFSLLCLDLDSLKTVNGFALHERGDQMLRRTGQATVAVSPEGALVFRVGGDEFSVLVATAATREAVELGERICAAVAAIEVPESDEPDPGPSHLACSIGVACYPADAQTADDVFIAADMALYRAKRAGGGCVVLADGESLTDG